MQLPKILALGKYLPDDLEVTVSASNRKIDARIEGRLEKIWEKKIQEAEIKGKTCYNGVSYRLNSIKKRNSKLLLDLGTIEFKARDGLIDIPEYFLLPEEFYRKGCFSTGTVKTSDGKYIMVELSGKSMNKNTVDLVGGIIETDNIFESFYAELLEEASIEKTSIEKSYLRAIFLGVNTNVGFYFDVILDRTWAEVLDDFKAKNNDSDIKSLLSFSREEYLDVLKNHKSKNKQIVIGFLNI